jgi:hypothetical protein
VEGPRQAVVLRGIDLEADALTVAPTTLGEDAFGPVLLDGSLVRAFQVMNPTAQPSGVFTLRTSDGFEVLTPPRPGECVEGSTSLVDGEGCTVRVAFTPLRRTVLHGQLGACRSDQRAAPGARHHCRGHGSRRKSSSAE